jgi:hypothetical protein
MAASRRLLRGLAHRPTSDPHDEVPGATQNG